MIEECGEDALRELLKNELSITEKINGHRLVAKKKRNGKVDFFTKKSKSPVGLLDNVLSDLYSNAIAYIINNKEKLPVGESSFYLLKNDLDVEYTGFSNQALVLTNVLTREEKTLETVAKDLRVKCQEELYDGFLDEEDIERIIDYVKGETSVLPVLMSTICDKHACLLNKDFNDVVDGYIFNIQHEFYKLEDKRVVRQEFKKVNTSTYELLVNDIVDFFTVDYIESLEVQATKRDFMYLEIISSMMIDFVKAKKKEELEFLSSLPTFSKNTGKVNTKYISNKLAKAYIEESEKYEYLFRVLLQLFRRELDSRGLIDEMTCSKHSKLKQAIEYKINQESSFESLNKK